MNTNHETDALTVNIDPQLKTSADQILTQVGISLDTAINLFLRQLVIEGQLPFVPQPKSFDELSTAEMNAIIQQGMTEIAAGKTYSVAEIRAQLHQED
ncbi:type II toxin-antitoxin system RelB/DinJ family antitoxin [Lactiplantibacillus fabifermentans]|uniref:DNA-damage-inducible protein J n=2 Tax=Lactiplantibacillus fabifermentans TaxID=483011 RepID=A0A0R2NRX0_9LACO|nr:type II toxin-antitoxin system RelB/DinJ family antitoxin [Lactiplantibacillus fabifermentans]ETY74880.1 hypothetical protein LFAB_05015 [Lactiplantibacillus fabifermentans T30PCM01]KRO28423.1 hypothetical protein DY78_GL002418 [Lactiplantibacillus fabifermentans DSM 21115]